MPHSSGGGSSGGGFHSGSHSGSGSSSTRRYSSRPFQGAHRYVYYDRYYHPHLIYANNAPEATVKGTWLTLVFISLFIICPIALFFFFGIHNPHKLSTSYDTTIVIRDDNNVLSDEEEASLNITFKHFLDETGITPAFISLDKSQIKYYQSLESYAYDTYLDLFRDEKHLLIVYSSDEGTIKENWSFESMQGNDTDPILYKYQADRFGKTFYNAMEEEYTTVGEALTRAFDYITPDIMSTTFYVETNLIVFLGSSIAIGGILMAVQIVSLVNRKKMKNASLVAETSTIMKCHICGTEYYSGTVSTCPKCGQSVDMPRIPKATEETDK